MLTMGIDQSFTSTGVVLLDPDYQIVHDETICTAKDDPHDVRIKQIYDRLGELHWAFEPTHLLIEGLAFVAKGNATRELAGLFYCIQDRLKYTHGATSIQVVPPTTLKKFATGKGNAGKPAVRESLPEDVNQYLSLKYPKSKGLSDIVDAYWLARWGQEILRE